MALLPVLSVPFLAFLAYEDQRHRAVSWLVFPFITLIFIWCSIHFIGFNEMIYNVLYNLGFLILQLLLISMYFSIKEKRVVLITRNYLGLGDILFLFCLAFFFSPLNYMTFYFASLLIIVTGVFVYAVFRKKQYGQLPLAGWQSIILIVLILMNVLSGYGYRFCDDSLLMHQLLSE
jgi:hypothetical protein